MVRTDEVHHLEFEILLLEVGGIPECNGELDASERSGLGPGDDLEEGRPTWAEVLPRDPHAVEGVNIEDVKAAPAIHQHLCVARSPDDGADNEQEIARARDVPGEVLVTKCDGHLRLVKVLLGCPSNLVDPL